MAHKSTCHICLDRENNEMIKCHICRSKLCIHKSTPSINMYIYYLFILKEYLERSMGKYYLKSIPKLILLRINVPVLFNCVIVSPTIIENPIYVSTKKNICDILCLNEWVGHNFGDHYPRELVRIIPMVYYKLIKIWCRWDRMEIFVADKIYTWNFDLLECYSENFNLLVTKRSIWDRNLSLELKWSIRHDTPDQSIIDPAHIKKSKQLSYSKIILSKSKKLYFCSNSYVKRMLRDVTKFDCGLEHVIAISSGNKIYVWGNNYYGQLGLGDNEPRIFPCELDLRLTDSDYVRSFSCGANHTILLTNYGHVYVWGSNQHGQLGLDVFSIRSPQKIKFKISMPKLIK
ncbi:MAG TPA: hypothetical protein VKR58_02230, partial [Aquella sp.]|nr:hypothetical protein [Aquella sp.]